MIAARAKAFALHAGCSIAVALLLLWLVFAVWYPAPLDHATGVRYVFLVLLCVDVVLGPLLTLIIYKPGKKGLVFDIGAVVFIQIAALLYGLNAVYTGRPAWVVFNVDRFDLVRAHEVDKRHIGEALPEFRDLPTGSPRWAASVPPTDEKIQQSILLESLQGGPDLPHRPEHYRRLERAAEMVKSRMHNLDELNNYNSPERVDALLADYGETAGWLPLMSNEQSMVVLLDSNGSVQGVVDLRPW